LALDPVPPDRGVRAPQRPCRPDPRGGGRADRGVALGQSGPRTKSRRSRYAGLAVLSPAATSSGWVRRASVSTSSGRDRASYEHTIVAGDDARARFTIDSYLNHSTTS